MQTRSRTSQTPNKNATLQSVKDASTLKRKAMSTLSLDALDSNLRNEQKQSGTLQTAKIRKINKYNEHKNQGEDKPRGVGVHSPPATASHPPQSQPNHNEQSIDLQEYVPKKLSIHQEMNPWTLSTVLQEAKKMFRTTTDSNIVGRDVEKASLAKFYQEHVISKQSGSIYVSGCPGSGKSASVEKLFKDAERDNAILVNINAMSFDTPTEIFSGLVASITGSFKTVKDALPVLNKLMLKTGKNDKMIVLILDEIDFLYTQDQEVLYKLFEWPTLAKSRLILVGIANSLDLVDRLLPRLKAKNCAPELLNFKAYDGDEMALIIKERLRMLERSFVTSSELHKASGSIPLFQSSAIELCVRKIAGTGDIRKAFDICRKAISLLETDLFPDEKRMDSPTVKSNKTQALSYSNLNEETKIANENICLKYQRSSPLKDLSNTVPNTPKKQIMSQKSMFQLSSPDTTPIPLQKYKNANQESIKHLDTIPKVTVQHIIKVSSLGFGNVQARKVKDLPMHHKLILVTLILMDTLYKQHEIVWGRVQETYFKLCNDERNNVPKVTRSEFNDLVSLLEAQSLLVVSNAKDERHKKITLNVRMEDIELGIKDIPLLVEVMARGIHVSSS